MSSGVALSVGIASAEVGVPDKGEDGTRYEFAGRLLLGSLLVVKRCDTVSVASRRV